MCRETLRRKAPNFKTYFCLFICMTTKAVHIELVHHLSSASFVAALQRFVSRRGLPAHVYSDNGTNFVGASRHLTEVYQWLKNEDTTRDIINYASSACIQWHFNPPSAPHFGGLWESNIKSVKTLIKRTIGDNLLTIEELTTLYSRVEAILNSRPLCSTSSSPNDPECLTPGHFLIGRPLVSVPEETTLDLRLNTLTRWQLVQRMTECLWKKWRLHYLSSLQQRSKWTTSTPNPSVDDVVILMEDNIPMLQWPIARIIKLHPGRDGIARVATIKTSKGIYTRPLVKLAPLPNFVEE